MHRLAIILAALALASCQTLGAAKLPVCDGKQRRPANPHGSVLTPSQAPKPAAVSAAPALQGSCRA